MYLTDIQTNENQNGKKEEKFRNLNEKYLNHQYYLF